jgi:putative endonuclease
MYYTYVLKSQKDKKLYIGYSDNLKQRLQSHEKGEVASTKNRRPFVLIYYEAFQNQQDATSREKYLKSQWGRNFLKKVLDNYFKLES